MNYIIEINFHLFPFNFVMWLIENYKSHLWLTLYFHLRAWYRLISWQRYKTVFFFLTNFSSTFDSDSTSSLSQSSVIQWGSKQEKKRSLCAHPHPPSSAELVTMCSLFCHVTIRFEEIDSMVTFVTTHPLTQANHKKLSIVLWPKGYFESGFTVLL